MGISFILMLLGIGVVVTAADDIVGGAESYYDMQVVLAIAFFSIIIFGALAIVKFRFANRLSSASLSKDAICSLIGTILAASLFVNTLIIESVPSIWWLDPAVAMILGFVAFGIGLHAVVIASCVQGLPIFTIHWWLVSQGDGMDEMKGRDLEPSDFGDGQDVVETKDEPTKPETTKLSEVV